ncbi:MAG TPA: hypothetical protein VIL88_17175 [Devosia sp.]|jgi:hypothetical protein|uniref:glucosamine inositolphosphorylceramide transferase family protein n=1 Tax=Devosia sp. TaxID=1871048 RepID=UPI002F934BC6
MAIIDLILPMGQTRTWHESLRSALCAEGHQVQIVHGHVGRAPLGLDAVLLAEKKAFRKADAWLSDFKPMPVTEGRNPSELSIALAPGQNSSTTLSFGAGENADPLPNWATEIAFGILPTIEIFRSGGRIAHADPMVDNRVIMARGLDDVLARAVTLMTKTVQSVLAGAAGRSTPKGKAGQGPFLAGYLSQNLPRLGRELLRRRRFQQAHWRVGFRFTEGLGVAETATLAGSPWHVLPDDAARFYADPFPFTWEGRHYMFVEDYVHALGKAVISVSHIDARGEPSVPVPIVEEPHHLSYPQVFSRDGQIWMLPEASAGRELVLYRCTEFPWRWERYAVLAQGPSLSDATLLDHDGCLWLFATDNSLGGSSSDTMVVFRADALTGPWRPHPQNPITIDRAAARPGGAIVRSGSKLILPLQNGTLGYGGGLGMAEIMRLTPEEVVVGVPRPVETKGYWPYPQIHTLNRFGSLEVIDGIAAVPRPR